MTETYPQKQLKISTSVFWPISRLSSNPASWIFFIVLCSLKLWTYWSFTGFRLEIKSFISSITYHAIMIYHVIIRNHPFIPTSLHFFNLQCWQTLSHSGLDIQSVSALNRHSKVFPANTDRRKNALKRFIRVCYVIFIFRISDCQSRLNF